jgi:signal transduction histidine kinase
MEDNTKFPNTLAIAIKELAFQNGEKEKRAAELAIANVELVFQNGEKEKRAAELTIANIELVFQNGEKEKRAAELTIANIELVFLKEEKGKREEELILINEALKKAKEYQREYLQGLKEMMFMTSHIVRQPITQIMGISYMLEEPVNSQEDLEKIIGYMKKSVVALDDFTRGLATLIQDLQQKGDS